MSNDERNKTERGERWQFYKLQSRWLSGPRSPDSKIPSTSHQTSWIHLSNRLASLFTRKKILLATPVPDNRTQPSQTQLGALADSKNYTRTAARLRRTETNAGNPQPHYPESRRLGHATTHGTWGKRSRSARIRPWIGEWQATHWSTRANKLCAK